MSLPPNHQDTMNISHSNMVEELLDVQSMLCKLKTILLEVMISMIMLTLHADSVNPTYPSHLFANIVRAEAAEDGLEKVNECKMIANNDRRRVQENQDLQRQLVFLPQQL